MSKVKMNRLFEKGSIPNHDHCVYRLLDSNGIIVYIGQTADMEKRIYQHLINGKDFSFFECLPCNKCDATEMEADEIVRYNPKLNTVLPKTPKYRTLDQARKSVSLVLRDKLNSELDKIMASINISFCRPKVKNMNFKYVLSDDVGRAIENLSVHEFIKLGEE